MTDILPKKGDLWVCRDDGHRGHIIRVRNCTDIAVQMEWVKPHKGMRRKLKVWAFISTFDRLKEAK